MEKISAFDVQIGMPVTVLHKDAPFCNSIVTDVRMINGENYLIVKGNVDDRGKSIPVSLDSCRKMTKGYYTKD